MLIFVFLRISSIMTSLSGYLINPPTTYFPYLQHGMPRYFTKKNPLPLFKWMSLLNGPLWNTWNEIEFLEFESAHKAMEEIYFFKPFSSSSSLSFHKFSQSCMVQLVYHGQDKLTGGFNKQQKKENKQTFCKCEICCTINISKKRSVSSQFVQINVWSGLGSLVSQSYYGIFTTNNILLWKISLFKQHFSKHKVKVI